MKPSSTTSQLTLLTFFLALSACGGGSGSADAAVPQIDGAPPSGTFSVSWTLKDGATPITCADVGAGEVVLTFLPSDGSTGFNESFSCAAGTGMSAPHPAQSYSIDFKIKDTFGKTLATLPRALNKTLVAGADTTLDPLQFEVSRVGKLAFKIDVPGAPGANCVDSAQGAGITGVRLELRNGAGTCVPTAFAVAGGATIAAACPGTISACIENDQVVSATDLTAGEYFLAIDGFEANSTTTPCYKTIHQLTVSGGGLETNLNTVQVPIDSTNAACVAP
jgi:hypothetical protein